jgi:pyruvate dehydrogenase E2 component (dihydrolipoamide acetyltransferase)
MSTAFKVPELGENIETAIVAKILVSEGDTIEKDQPVLELETEKAVAEVPSDVAGIVERIHAKEDDEVNVGQTVMTLKSKDPEKTEGGKSESVRERKETGRTATDEPSAEAEEKKRKKAEEPEEEALPEAGSEKGKEAVVTVDREEKEKASKKEDSGMPVPAAPSVRRFAREIGVDIAEVEGRGPHGRISIDDVKAHAKARRQTVEKGVGRSAEMPLPDFSQWGEIQRESMSTVRRLTAEHMAYAAAMVPQAVQFGRADITEIEALRRRYQQEAEQTGGHLSLTVILVKILAAALKAFPRFNASLDAEADTIIYRKYCHVGVAVDTDRGLLVPVIREADCKSVNQLARELHQLTEQARAGKLGVEDMQGGCISLSNAGALGGGPLIPIVNWPEAAILGVGRSRPEAVYINDVFTPRPMLPLILSYDHRLNDGADAVRFMNWIVEMLEEPVKLAWKG